jgi:hypothetical protein
LSFNRRLRSALVVLSMLVAIAAHAQAPNTSAPASAPSARATTSPSVGSLETPTLAGIARMQNDPASRAVLGGPAVGNMTYHGGPVQHTQKVFTIFWNPSGPAFPAGYQTTINQFVQDLNGSTYYGIGSQYNDTTSHISTVLTYGGTWLDTANAIPEVALTGQDLLNEVERAKAANGWTSDGNSYFQIYTPSGIVSSTANICGAHYFYAPEPFGQILFPQSGCFPGSPYPNSSFADAAINTSAHEIMETVTDPVGNAWFFNDTSGEIGDQCNFMFGARAADGSDVTLNGHKYLIQQAWSNAVSGCSLSYSIANPLMSLDSPANGSTVGASFPVSGWSIDRGAVSGTGVDAVYVWAYPNPGSGTAPVFVGQATYGLSRPDIGGLFGSQFTSSGYSLTASGLAAGRYQITAFGHSVVTNTIAASASAIVTVASGPVSSPAIALDSPSANSSVGATVTFAGWAIDRGAPSGTGVDAVYVWAYPSGGGAPQFVGQASYGSARPDIGGIFGSQFTNSGYRLTIAVNPGTYTFVAFMHSTVANAVNGSASVPNVTVKPAITAFVAIDTPGPNTMATRPFTLSGWAVDTAAPTGTGIDLIAVWAYPVSGATPIFVGFGSYGASRPDIGTLFGNVRFASSGYSLTVTSTLPAGVYHLIVFGHSTVTGGYTAVGVTQNITVQ